MGKFVEWEKTQPRRQSYSAFSRYLGIRQTTFSQWINGNGIPSYEKAVIIAKKLGDEVYGVLGFAVPDSDVLFPAFLRIALEEARDKIVQQGLSGDSPEAVTIITDALSKRGFRLISKTEDDGSA